MINDAVYAMISRGETAGVFQLESQGMTQFMKELQPESLEDIIAGISLYRPGPMDQIPRYIKSKNNPSLVSYAHPMLEPILNVSYGCMIYQEQVMQIVRDIGGYSLGRSDLVRRAMSKKKKDVMDAERRNFIYGKIDDTGNVSITGALRNGMDEVTANKLFDEMMDFASYAFNKSHAAAYAVVGYQTAWLRYYHPVPFMAALLNSFLGSLGKVSEYVLECRKMGIQVLPPHINESYSSFSSTGRHIRFGLSAVKNVGINVVQALVAERDLNGPYRDFVDFCERLSGKELNKKTVESLIQCGAFESFHIYRSRMMAQYESIIDQVMQTRRNKLDGQFSLFDVAQTNSLTVAGDGIHSSSSISVEWPEIEEYSDKLLMVMEKEMLGLYLSGHPLDPFIHLIEKYATVTSKDFLTDNEEETTGKLLDGQQVITAGIIAEMKSISTRSNKMMAFLTLEDLTGQFEVIIFPNVLEANAAVLVKEQPVWVEGRISIKEEEEPKILAERLLVLELNGPVPKFQQNRNGSGNWYHNSASIAPLKPTGESPIKPSVEASMKSTMKAPPKSGVEAPIKSTMKAQIKSGVEAPTKENDESSARYHEFSEIDCPENHKNSNARNNLGNSVKETEENIVTVNENITRPYEASKNEKNSSCIRPPQGRIQQIRVRTSAMITPTDELAMASLIQYFAGDVPLLLYAKGSDSRTEKAYIDANPLFVKELELLSGKDNVKVIYDCSVKTHFSEFL